MTNEKQLLDTWYRYAAEASGFIGGALKRHRSQHFLTQEQQRTLLRIQDNQYDQLWLRLCAMSLPREKQWRGDLERIITRAAGGGTIETPIDLECLRELIGTGRE